MAEEEEKQSVIHRKRSSLQLLHGLLEAVTSALETNQVPDKKWSVFEVCHSFFFPDRSHATERWGRLENANSGHTVLLSQTGVKKMKQTAPKPQNIC